MKYSPISLGSDIFTESEHEEIKKLVRGQDAKVAYPDKRHSRDVKKFKELDAYADKLVPLAREIFNDETLLPTYSVYLSYGPGSHLTMHKDVNACTYTIDYCVSANIDWPLIIEDEKFSIPEREALAFMGGLDLHGREFLEGPEGLLVENIMFHFCPADHWYFTEGPEYIKVLAEQGKLETY